MAAGNDRELTALVFMGLLCVFIYRVVLWVMAARRTEDPWGTEVDQALNTEDATPLCHRCLAPQKHNGWFCPECGSTVGPYANYMPYIYLFSQGEVLRAGVSERLRQTPMIVIGYVLLCLGFFPILAPLLLIWMPLYLISLALNLRRSQPGISPTPPPLP